MNEAKNMLAKMSPDELDKLILELGRYAKYKSKSKKYFWRVNRVESVVSIAFFRVLKEGNKKRIWNPQKHPDFKKYMMDVIDSTLYNLTNGKDNRLIKQVPENINIDDLEMTFPINHKDGIRENNVDWLGRTPLTPEQIFENNEDEILAEKTFNLLKAKIQNDSELVLIVEAIEEGCDPNSDIEIQIYTKLDIKRVRNAKKRLDRRILSLKKEFESLKTYKN